MHRRKALVDSWGELMHSWWGLMMRVRAWMHRQSRGALVHGWDGMVDSRRYVLLRDG